MRIRFSVFCPFVSPLLKLNNPAANLEVGGDLEGVDVLAGQSLWLELTING